MDFIQNTINWIKGEVFEASLILSFGIITLVGVILLWKIGSTPNSRALLLPFVVTGVIYAGIGSGILVSNQKRIQEFPRSYQQDEKKFILLEKQRVEDFQYAYTISKIVATIFFACTLFIFWYTQSPTWQGIGIGLAYFALAGLVIDYFSQERADIYYNAILKAL
jgi:hypothetical protein